MYIYTSLVVSDGEIYNLVLYFKDLDTNNAKKLTNDQFLEFPYFKYSPYKIFLSKGLMLRDEGDILTDVEDNSVIAKEEEKESKPAINDDTSKVLGDKTPFEILINKRKNAYIDIKAFIKYLTVFNTKTSIDDKIQCKFFNI